MVKLKEVDRETVEPELSQSKESEHSVKHEEASETTSETTSETIVDSQDIDEILNSLKSLLSSVEKLQKVRQEVGDIKSLVIRMLDGEMVSGEELEQLKVGIGGLFRLVRTHSDHQSALAKAQPARNLLDEVLKTKSH